ncbi:hypothetical protein BD310DRAFT_944808 [Dichomitus squalens]|uniref:Uncharacterized protein n=1 Tax=Dichomitus squalens TaxID=114155 RepID=A0A4Q9Q9I7_9APHY|nr:hypothetical protein BD310DRAFT_944808 [Dichomitus squalens]
MKLLSIFALLSTVWVVSASPVSQPDFAYALTTDEAAVTCNCQEEYPVFKGATYTGAKPPGPDRVIYQTNGGQFCGKCCVTHTNAGGNAFLKCT